MKYIEALEKAVVYIEANLNKELKVEEVALRVGYSYYYFERIFESFLGESIGNYIRKRRLAKAAYELTYTDQKIIDIAFKFHFDSPEAFTRAFKKVYLMSPYQYRKNRINGMWGNKQPLNLRQMEHLYKNVSLVPIIIEVEPIKVIGIRINMTFEYNQLPQLWDQFNHRVHEISPINRRCFGICEYKESVKLEGFNDYTEHSQVVGMEVDEFRKVPKGMIKKVIPGGKYAIFTHKGKTENLRATYQYIWGTWVTSSKEQLDFRDDFECYDERFRGKEDEASEIDIYIPLK